MTRATTSGKASHRGGIWVGAQSNFIDNTVVPGEEREDKELLGRFLPQRGYRAQPKVQPGFNPELSPLAPFGH
jgi:hypothetical protein